MTAPINRLFVYGTLAPGRANAHIVSGLNGTWQPAKVRGQLKQIGWGANMGYPGIVLDEQAPWVEGLLLCTDNLEGFWDELDAFEGEEYQRVLINVLLPAGEWVAAYVYALAIDV